MTCTDDIMPILSLFAEHDLCDMLNWRCDGEYAPITFWINCNDLFAWATADGEDITIERLPVLKTAIEDCIKINSVLGAIYGCNLYACRVRGMRPQGCCYPQDPELWPLFDASGPERETGLGNPYKRGDRPASTSGVKRQSKEAETP